jgi:hypothetical protein
MEAVMRTNLHHTRPAGMILTLMGCLLLFWLPVAAAQDNSSGMSTDAHLVVQGTIKRISFEKGYITLKPSKQDRVKIFFDAQTELVRMPSLEKLNKGQRLKVWYTVIGTKNRAVKIEKLPDLGC